MKETEGSGGASAAGRHVDEREMRGAIEAIMLVLDQPADDATLAQVLEQPRATVRRILEGLAEEYARDDRGFELRSVAGGWRMYTRDDFATYVERFALEGQQAKLTQAALETLAVVAYRQPVTRSRVGAVRGVNVDAVMRTLLHRGLVAEAGTEPDTGATLYRTTDFFLERLGLRSLEDLPALSDYLPEASTIDELEEQASG